MTVSWTTSGIKDAGFVTSDGQYLSFEEQLKN